MFATKILLPLIVLPLCATFDGGGSGWVPPIGYSGPGDTTPGGPSTGGGSTPGPSTPQPGGASGPSTPTPASGPAAGKPMPAGPTTGASQPKSPGSIPGGPSTGGDLGRMLEATWDVWWLLHREEFLELKERVHSGLSTPAELSGGVDRARLLTQNLRPRADEVQAQVVPVLRALLASEKGNDVVAGAQLALARIGEAPGAESGARNGPQIARFLRDPNQEVSERSALALGILGDAQAVPLLCALLEDEPAGREAVGAREVPLRVRSFAAYALGLIGSRAQENRTRQLAARALSAVLERREGSAADTQVACVIAFGLVPLDVEVEESSTAAWVSRQTQLRFLIGLALQHETRALLRAHALTALALLQRESTPEAKLAVAECILEVLHNGRSESSVRESAIMALGQLGDDDEDEVDRGVRAELARALSSGSTTERCFALMALSECAARRGSAQRAPTTLADVRARLLGDMVQGSSRSRPWAALALGVLEFRLRRQNLERGATVATALEHAFSAASGPEEEAACAVALGLSRAPEGSRLLLARLGKTSDEVLRGYLALALGLAHESSNAPALRTLVGESNFRPFQLQQGAIALTLLGEKAHVETLLAQLQNAQGVASQGWIAQALGFVGDARSLPGLLALVKEIKLSDRTRGYVALALGIVCDKDDRSWSFPISSSYNWRAASSTLLGGDGTGVLELL